MRAITLCALVALGLPLAACFTPRVNPQVSQAVLDARAHRDVAVAACDSSMAPLSAGFEFGEAALTNITRTTLDKVVVWTGCHPQAVVAIKGAADGHGTAAEQATLAQQRVATVTGYLTSHGVAAARLRPLGASEAEPTAEHMLVMAEGKRW